MLARLVSMALVVVSACSGVEGNGLVDDAGPDSDAALDLARARWIHSAVSSDSATVSVGSDMAISSTGEMAVIWSESLDGDSTVFAAVGEPDFPSERLFEAIGATARNASIASGTEALHVVANADGGASNSDIFYTRRSGGSWSTAVNLTAGVPLQHTDFSPVVLEVAGETVVFYRSSVFSMAQAQDAGIYMLRFTDPQSPGPALPIMDRDRFDCGTMEAVLDSGGSIHLITHCKEGDAAGRIYYITDRSGSFVASDIIAPNTTNPLSPDIAISRGGDVVHLLWNASGDCGGLTCRDVFYSRDLTAPVSVTGGEEDGGFFPHVVVDELDRVIVVFHRLGDVDDVMWTYAETGNAFVRVQLATPGTPDATDLSVGDMVIDPLTGRPRMVYTHSIVGPSGSDIFHGQLVR